MLWKKEVDFALRRAKSEVGGTCMISSVIGASRILPRKDMDSTVSQTGSKCF